MSKLNIEKLQNWLDGKYVDPQEFKDSLKRVIEQVEHYERKYENTGAIFNRMNMKRQIEELTSLNLWSARRLYYLQHKDYVYNELEKITGQKHERV